jgi:hypothetical protein
MTILSIDVGIKNLALCILTKQEEKHKILLWDVVNLLESDNVKKDAPLCNCHLKPKTKKLQTVEPKLCCKTAKYSKGENYYCLKHAKTTQYIVPNKQTSLAFIKKQKICALKSIAENHSIEYNQTSKKCDLIEHISNYYTANCVHEIETPKNISASKIDLITVGRNIQTKLDEILNPHLETITDVVIENQISPIANRMKTIQGMIAQYFIMRNTNIHISFANASNKLKISGIPILSEQTISTYKDRKKQGITNTLELLENHMDNYEKWSIYFNTNKKKDDLADSFLQAIWYIHNQSK